MNRVIGLRSFRSFKTLHCIKTFRAAASIIQQATETQTSVFKNWLNLQINVGYKRWINTKSSWDKCDRTRSIKFTHKNQKWVFSLFLSFLIILLFVFFSGKTQKIFMRPEKILRDEKVCSKCSVCVRRFILISCSSVVLKQSLHLVYI